MIYKIIVDKQPMTNPSADKKEYEIDIAPLYFKHDVYDSLVITKDEDYVMRRLELQDYNVLVELDPPVKEPLTDINIELFEGDNYIYLYDMAGNKIVAEYLVKNEFNETYVIYSEMHSAIRQSASEIELTVGGQVTTLDGAVRDINGELSLKLGRNENDQVVSMINASADEITLNSNRLIINSTNFKLARDGTITATNGNFEGNVNIKATDAVNVYNSNNVRVLYLRSNGLNFYDDNSNFSASVASLMSNNVRGIDISYNAGRYFSINKQVGDTYTTKMRIDDTGIILHSIPLINGASNGTIFSDNDGGGITVNNGLITNWSLTTVTGVFSIDGRDYTFKDGLLCDVS